jgi:hypothetical protein
MNESLADPVEDPEQQLSQYWLLRWENKEGDFWVHMCVIYR